jgi:hypothetical protein
MSCDEDLTHALAEKWRTEWRELNTEEVARQLERLYWLRDFTMSAGESIPRSWQRFLVSEIAAGEAWCEEAECVEAN